MFVAAAVLLLTECRLCAAAGPAHKEALQGTVQQNEMIDRLESFGIKCVIHVAGARKTLYVDTVRPGSKAFYKGVTAGDFIQGLVKKDENTFVLTILRELTPYQVTFKGAAMKPSLDQSQNAPNITVDQDNLAAGVEKTADPREKALLKYDIEILIDTSGSMKDEDGTDGLSKFDWCHTQVLNLAQKLVPYQRSLTITTFNSGWQTRENCLPDQVEKVFAGTTPGGGTNLVTPLQASLERSQSRALDTGRKAMVCVITDGLPTIPADPTEVNRMIARFTQHLFNPDQILVVFFQIGKGFNGRDFCKALDDNLVAQGAKFDIVDTQTFDELKETGLTDALINSIIEEKLARRHNLEKKPLTDLSNDEELQQLKRERAEIEKELLRN